MSRGHLRRRKRPITNAAMPSSSSEPLDRLLSEVVERRGVPIAIAPQARMRLRTERVTPSVPVPSQPDDVLAHDQRMMRKLIRLADARKSSELAIKREAHEPSPHLLEMIPTARRTMMDVQEMVGATIPSWVAPYDAPPSIEQFSSLAQDLYVESVDPRSYQQQFTPADADMAFGMRYDWWAKVRTLFVKWEVRKGESVAEHVVEFVDDMHDQERDIIAQAERAWHVPMLVPKVDAWRVLGGLCGLLVVVTIPAGAVSLSRSFGSSIHQVIRSGQQGLLEAQSATHGSLYEQEQALGRASVRFTEASNALAQANALALGLAQALPQTRALVGSASGLLRAGEQASRAGEILAEGLARAFDGPVAHPDERLLTLRTYLEAAQPVLDEARVAIGDVQIEALPAEDRARVTTLARLLTVSQSTVRDVRTLIDLMVAVLGHDGPRTYLVLFQNQTELRPTGGFMGSLAEITVDRGEIKKTVVPGGGPYDFRDQLMARVVPPKPLQLVAARWEFQDANWFPDFPAAAQKVRWFWSKAGQPTTDGVIAVNESVMEKLLAVTGPIEMPEYGKTITADNFLMEAQKQVELEYDKTENKPKKFIGDLMPKMLERLRGGSREQTLALLGVLADALETKDVQGWFANPEEDAIASQFHFRGELKPTQGDMLALVEANIAGQKTDAVIDEDVKHDVSISDDGTIDETVTITRTHHGERGELFRGANNVAYLRLYAPLGSTLLSADGFQTPSSTFFKTPLAEDPTDTDVARLVQNERTGPNANVAITDEFGETAFGGWIQLAPGQTRSTTFHYRLPFTAFDIARITTNRPETMATQAGYLLTLVSQSGKTARTISTELHTPSSWTQTWSYPSSSTNATLTQDVWDRDRVLARWFSIPAHEPPFSP